MSGKDGGGKVDKGREGRDEGRGLKGDEEGGEEALEDGLEPGRVWLEALGLCLLHRHEHDEEVDRVERLGPFCDACGHGKVKVSGEKLGGVVEDGGPAEEDGAEVGGCGRVHPVGDGLVELEEGGGRGEEVVVRPGGVLLAGKVFVVFRVVVEEREKGGGRVEVVEARALVWGAGGEEGFEGHALEEDEDVEVGDALDKRACGRGEERRVDLALSKARFEKHGAEGGEVFQGGLDVLDVKDEKEGLEERDLLADVACGASFGGKGLDLCVLELFGARL